MKAKPFLIAAPAALALALSGCGGSTGNTTSGGGNTASGDCSSADVFCVGLVTDTGTIDDKSFNQAAWEAVKSFEGSGATVKPIETKDPKDYANNIKQFTDQKYDAVVTVGFLMTEATRTAAEANPNTKFIGVDQFQESDVPNVTGLVFPEQNAGYAAGYLAGLMTKTNKIGVVLGQEIPPTQNYAKGYEQGSKAANPKVSVAKVYHPAGDNAFSDPAWGAGEAKKMLAQGADFIFGAGGGTGNGAIGEAAKASGAGESVYCIGVDLDQWNTVPEAQPCLVTSAEKKLTDGTKTLLDQVKDGSIKGGNFFGKTGLAPYHDFDSKIPADVKTKVDEVIKGLEDESIKVS
ncbi:nucleoside-binding protein [Knoellia remsis]|uniref:Nucleoside-binding protein n=1 Tax=Knoellia remsis TaxID=407159 RepID=A0A2T0TWA8_9MICO|nr:BMP family ABC transporter substrate-binding protein [Knoellia remsis]PRY49951.1 nucleoside-binding protein [Knoellia remsis]